MARMPSGQPRSVTDPDGEAYDAMLRRGRAKGGGPFPSKHIAARPSAGHPGFGESLIPVWGAGREAVADFQDGDYLGAGVNTVLAASDLLLAGAALKTGVRIGAKLAARAAAQDAGKRAQSTTWNATRKRMQKEGFIPKGEQGHHWLIPQNGLGKRVPEIVKNDHANIKPLSPNDHKRIHSNDRVLNKPRFNPVERYVYGTPTTAKVATGAAVGHPAAAAKARHESDR